MSMATKEFEVVIFTASNQNYADLIIDKILTSAFDTVVRLYRHNCVYYHGLYIKDLKNLGRNLS
jgi:CTD small phosphatase-like protein 2